MFKFPPKAQAVVLGETIEYISAGSGPSTTVFINGSGGPIEGWHKVFGNIATFSKVFAYNRAGIGGSSGPTIPQVGSHMMHSLRGVLQEAGLPPPYVLVGHSLGGLIANLFARSYPSDIAAVVMLEATSPEDVSVLARYETRLQRLAHRVLDTIVPQNPHAESKHMTATVAELQQAPAFPAIPLTVVSGGKPAMTWATAPEALSARASHQQELVALSPFGERVIASRSGHFPQFSEPELVITVVHDAIERSLASNPALARQP